MAYNNLINATTRQDGKIQFEVGNVAGTVAVRRKAAGINPAGLPLTIGTFTVTTNPGNISPTANAGVDQTITLPTNSITLNGSGSDSDGTITNYLWAILSGNGGNITNPTQSITTVTDLQAGNYVFQLTVVDNSGSSSTDTVALVVNPEQVGTTPNLTLSPNNFVLSGSDINQWNDSSGVPNHFVSAAAATSKPVRDANGFAVFNTGDCLVSQNPLSNVLLTQLSVFVRVNYLPVDHPDTASSLVGCYLRDSNKRQFHIATLNTGTGDRFSFTVSKNGLGGATDAKIYSIPYSDTEQALGFIFDNGVLTIYRNGVIVTGTDLVKNQDAAMTTIFNTDVPMTIGHPLTSTGALDANYISPDATIKKVFIKKGIATAEEIAAM